MQYNEAFIDKMSLILGPKDLNDINDVNSIKRSIQMRALFQTQVCLVFK